MSSTARNEAWEKLLKQWEENERANAESNRKIDQILKSLEERSARLKLLAELEQRHRRWFRW